MKLAKFNAPSLKDARKRIHKDMKNIGLTKEEIYEYIKGEE